MSFFENPQRSVKRGLIWLLGLPSPSPPAVSLPPAPADQPPPEYIVLSQEVFSKTISPRLSGSEFTFAKKFRTSTLIQTISLRSRIFPAEFADEAREPRRPASYQLLFAGSVTDLPFHLKFCPDGETSASLTVPVSDSAGILLEGKIGDTLSVVSQCRSSWRRFTTVGQVVFSNFFKSADIGFEITCQPTQSVLIGGHIERSFLGGHLTVGGASQYSRGKWAFSGTCNNDRVLSAQFAAAYAASESTTAATGLEFCLGNLESQWRFGIHRAFLASGASVSFSSFGVVNSHFQWNIKPGHLLLLTALADHRRGIHTFGIGYNITVG
jgi:hypothetical protein